MGRMWGVGGVVVALAIAGCSLLTDLGGYADGAPDASPTPPSADATVDVSSPIEASTDASGCSCKGLVSAYRFADPSRLGADLFGTNDMVNVYGNPQASTVTPPGLGGHSIELDGASSVCINGATFDSSQDHTLCWWAQPSALASLTNQFAQSCVYDTWTGNGGVDYLWRLDNCSEAPANLTVANVYAVGKWVQICQTYRRASLTRTVVVDGVTATKTSVTDKTPIHSTGSPWCIGSYSGSGGFWKGRIYLPMWFDRALSDAEIEQVASQACCLP